MNQSDLFVKMILLAWESQSVRTSKLIDSLTDEQFMSETAPGRNRGIYLVGHLTAVNDSLFPLLGIGDRIFPQYENIFIQSPDRAVSELPAIAELKSSWSKVYQMLSEKFKKMSVEEWFSRHMSVSEEDFAKAPHRNRLNVVISRTNHESSHYGQLIFLQKKS